MAVISGELPQVAAVLSGVGELVRVEWWLVATRRCRWQHCCRPVVIVDCPQTPLAVLVVRGKGGKW